ENGKLVWTDPSQPKVQDYNIALAKYVAQLGADEIQFDYVRFPAEGDQKDAAFVYQNGLPEPAREAQVSQPPVSTDSTCLVSDSTAAPAAKRRKNTAHGASRGTVARDTTKAPEGRQTKGACKVAAPRGPQRTDVITGFLKKAYS